MKIITLYMNFLGYFYYMRETVLEKMRSEETKSFTYELMNE